MNFPRITSRCYTATAVLSLASLLAGCCCSTDPTKGYTTASLYRENIHTVAVPIWQRGQDVYRRGLEYQLTEAITKRIELDTPYKVVPKSRADSVLEGRISSIDQRVMSFDPNTGQARDIEIRMSVDFTWVDLRTGEVLVDQKNVHASGVYYFPAPFSEDFFEGSSEAVNQMAERVVESMEKPW